MEITNYCITAGTSILFLIGCLVHLGENDTFSVKTIRKFQTLTYVLMFEIIIDCAFALLEKQSVASSLLYLIKYLELSLNPVLAFLVFGIFYDKKSVRHDRTMVKIHHAMLAMIILGIALQAATIFGKGVFFIDEANAYHRGPLVYAYLVVLLITIILLVSGILTFSNKTQSIMKGTLSSFTIILITGIILRNIFPNTNYDFLCMSVSIPFMLVYYSHVTLRIDPLTRLLNRHVYSRLIKKISYTTIVITIDVNDFKQINDTYGHECGDQTLRQLAGLICKAYGRYAYCFRTGGDEFCAILKPGIFERLIDETPHHDAYSMASKLMTRLEELIRAENKPNADSYLSSGVSQGYGIFYSQSSYPSIKEQISIEKVIELADRRMYKNKAALHKSDTTPTPQPSSNQPAP